MSTSGLNPDTENHLARVTIAFGDGAADTAVVSGQAGSARFFRTYETMGQFGSSVVAEELPGLASPTETDTIATPEGNQAASAIADLGSTDVVRLHDDRNKSAPPTTYVWRYVVATY